MYSPHSAVPYSFQCERVFAVIVSDVIYLCCLLMLRFGMRLSEHWIYSKEKKLNVTIRIHSNGYK